MRNGIKECAAPGRLRLGNDDTFIDCPAPKMSLSNIERHSIYRYDKAKARKIDSLADYS
jgi:hypothetical protein